MSRKLTILAGAMFLAIPATVHADYQDAVLALNPTVYYQLDETSGTMAVDASGNGYDATYVGQQRTTTSDPWTDWPAQPGGIGPRPSDGFTAMSSSNTGASLEKGVDNLRAQGILRDSVSTTIGLSTTVYSVSLWFNSSAIFATGTDGKSTLHYLFARSNTDVGGSHNHWSIQDSLCVFGYKTDSARLAFIDIAGDEGIVGATPTTLVEDTWYHVAFVRDGDNVHGYLNGQLEFSGASALAMTGGTSGTETYTGDWLFFGNRSDYLMHGDLGLEGVVDEVAVFDRALSATQVDELYTAATEVPEPSTVGMLLSIMGAFALLAKRVFRN